MSQNHNSVDCGVPQSLSLLWFGDTYRQRVNEAATAAERGAPTVGSFLEQVAADLEGGAGGDYLNGAEKGEMILNSVPFTITSAQRGKTRFNDDAFTLGVQVAGEDRLIEFKAGSQKGEETSRDRTLQGLIDSGELDSGPVGPVILVKLTPGAQGFVTVAPVGTPIDSEGVRIKQDA